MGREMGAFNLSPVSEIRSPRLDELIPEGAQLSPWMVNGV